jgi:hypothetical protein
MYKFASDITGHLRNTVKRLTAGRMTKVRLELDPQLEFSPVRRARMERKFSALHLITQAEPAPVTGKMDNIIVTSFGTKYCQKYLGSDWISGSHSGPYEVFSLLVYYVQKCVEKSEKVS